VVASSLVINSYAGTSTRIQWSYEEESPGRDARGFGYDPAPTDEFETGLVNVVLTNGARLYVDHAHPEYSTPECYDPLEAALYDKAGELVLEQAALAATRGLLEGQRLHIHKNNSDGKGNSYGAHENYLVDRRLPFVDLTRHLIPFFVSRQIYTGSGKVGSENGRPPSTSRSPSEPTSSRKRSGWRPRSSGPSSIPAMNRTRTRSLPAPARDHR
jgi:Pup amidohydrolase